MQKWSEIKRRATRQHGLFQRIKERDWHLVRRELRIMWFYYFRNYLSPVVWWQKISYWIRARLFIRGHVIRLRGLEPGYYDPDHRMLVGIFTTLCEYVEKELGGLDCVDRSIIFWSNPLPEDRHSEVAKDMMLNHFREVKSLYVWWTQDRDKIDHSTDRLESYEKETQMALRAVKIRGKMWT